MEKIEPEELIEDSIKTNLDLAEIDVPIFGVLQSCLDQDDTEDTYIYVKVDQTSQDLDFVGPNVPHTYSATIGVRMAQSDSRDGKDFVLTCRKVRAVVNLLLGDGCARLDNDGFSCDSVILESTATEFEGGENPINVKTYTLRITGRTEI